MEHKLIPYEAVDAIAATAALVLAPHPDDEVLGCGGAIRRHVEAGVPVRVIVTTDGALGLAGDARARQAALRQAESRTAAQVLGYGEPEFWDLPDQSLAYGEELVERIAQALPGADLVYAPSILEMHPDHRALAMAAVEAVRRAGSGVRLAAYEIGTPIRPNLLLDISPVAARKHAALQCFVSQLAAQPYDQHIEALNRYRTYTLPGHVTAAEGFLVVDAEDLSRDPFRIYRPEYQRQAALGLPLDARDLPRVSVIVRSMGRPELREALDSLALQTYANLEVLVVDAAGVQPDLGDRCGRFPLRVVDDGAGLGRSRAANLGLAEARGDLVAFLDDDDLMLPDHVARLVRTLAEGGEARAAYAGVRVEGESGVIDVYDQDFNPARMLAWNHLPIMGVLFERGLFEEGCAFDETLDLYEDWDFWLQVSRRTAFARAPGVSAVYRAHLGRSALTRPDCEAARDAARHQVWRKWLPAWSPQAFEALITGFRTEQAEQARALAHAAFTEAELRRILDEERMAARSSEATVERLLTEERATARRNEATAERLLMEERARLAECGRAAEHAARGSAARIRELEREVAAYRRSTSWRITAPVRAALQLLRGRS